MTRPYSSRLVGCALAFTAVSTAAPAIAQDDDAGRAAALAALEEALPGTLMNDPFDVEWVVYGDAHRSKVVEAEGVPGGLAYQVKVKGKQENPWDVSVQNAVRDGVSQGDVVLMAFWGRATEGGPVPFVPRVAEKAEPYAATAEGPTTLGPDWQLHYISGRAPRDWAPGALALNFNVATGKHTVQFGQYYVMNLGPDADPARMPSGPTNP